LRINYASLRRPVISRAAQIVRHMALSLRHTGLASPAFAEWADYCVVEDGQVIGRIYEDRHTQLRWFWSITVYVDPALGVTTNGRVPTLEEAKARFESSWSKCR
jgi:hypothetical protein